VTKEEAVKTFVILLCAVVMARADDGPFKWLDWFESTNASIVGVEADRAGNVYVVGNYLGTVRVESRQLPFATTPDIFILKLTRHGKPIWVHRLDSGGDDGAIRMDVSDNGDVYLCGRWGANGEIDGAVISSAGPFVARIHRKLSWSRTFAPDEEFGGVVSLALSPKNGSLWAFGKMSSRMYLKNYSVEGEVMKEAFLNSHWYANPADVAADKNGNVLITGTLSYDAYDERTFAIGDRTNIIAYVPARQFTASFDCEVKLRWLTGVPSQWYGIDSGLGLAIDVSPDGSVISAGRVLRSAGGLPNWYAFVSKHAPDGTLLWVNERGENRGAYIAFDVAVDHHGNSIMTGYAQGHIFNPASRQGVMLIGYDHQGALLFEERINSLDRSDANIGTSVCVDRKGTAYVGGILAGSPIIGTNALPWQPSSSAVWAISYDAD
jgi:hypothetical protein